MPEGDLIPDDTPARSQQVLKRSEETLNSSEQAIRQSQELLDHVRRSQANVQQQIAVARRQASERPTLPEQ